MAKDPMSTDRARQIALETQLSPKGLQTMSDKRLSMLVRAKERRDERNQGMITLPSINSIRNPDAITTQRRHSMFEAKKDDIKNVLRT